MGVSGSKGIAHKTAKVHSRTSLLTRSYSKSAMATVSGQAAADEFTICRILVPSRIIEHYLSEATSLLASSESALAQTKGNRSTSTSTSGGGANGGSANGGSANDGANGGANGGSGDSNSSPAALGAFLPKFEIPVRPLAEEYEAAVLFADISGFSKLAEALQVELSDAANAAEDLSNYVGSSLNMMVERITGAGGDVIKFAGDAILAIFPTGPKTDLAAATLIACQVALELLTLELRAGGVKLSVHCGVGAGTIMGYHIGGLNNRWEYFISGQVIEQIGSAEKEAEAGEVVISREAFVLLARGVVGMMPKSAVPKEVRNLIRDADKRARARREEKAMASAAFSRREEEEKLSRSTFAAEKEVPALDTLSLGGDSSGAHPVDTAEAKEQSEVTACSTAATEDDRNGGDNQAADAGTDETGQKMQAADAVAEAKAQAQQENDAAFLSELCTKLARFARAVTAPKAGTHHRRTSSMGHDEETIPINAEVMTSGTGNYKLLAINVTGRLLSAHATAKVRSQELLAALQPQSSTCRMVVKALKSYIPGPVLLSILAKQSVWSAQVRSACLLYACVWSMRERLDFFTFSSDFTLLLYTLLLYYSVLAVHNTLYPPVRNDVQDRSVRQLSARGDPGHPVGAAHVSGHTVPVHRRRQRHGHSRGIRSASVRATRKRRRPRRKSCDEHPPYHGE